MKTPHKHADVIKAWADGAEVQYKSQIDNGWHSVSAPFFDAIDAIDYEWRIKPEPKPDVVEALCLVRMGGLVTHLALGVPNVHITFDGETGKLKAAEVV